MSLSCKAISYAASFISSETPVFRLLPTPRISAPKPFCIRVARLYYGFVIGHLKRGESLLVAHERVAPTDSVRLSSNRAFGLAIGAALAAISVAPAFHGKPIRVLPLVAAAAFAALAVVLPSILAPLHRIWFRIALMLHAVMSPLIMALLFFGVLTPVAILMRLFGRNALDRGGFGDPSFSTFWIARARGPISMKVPF